MKSYMRSTFELCIRGFNIIVMIIVISLAFIQPDCKILKGRGMSDINFNTLS